MRISRRSAAVVAALCLVFALPAALTAAEVEGAASGEPVVVEPQPGAAGATGLENDEPAEAAAASEEKPKERTGVVEALQVEIDVQRDDKTTTETVTWKIGEPEPAGVRAGKLTRVEIRTEEDGIIGGTPAEVVHRLVGTGKLSPGDRVAFTGGDDEVVGVARKIPGGARRVLSLAGGLGALLIFAWAALGSLGNVKKLVIGEDNRYSSSKFQIVLWFAVLIALYLSAVLLRSWASFGALVAGIGIPTNLLLLSGLSVLSFAGAKGIKQGQIASAQARHVEATKEAARMQATATHVSAAAQGGNVAAIRRAAVLGAQAGVVQGEADRTRAMVEKITKPGKPKFPYDLVQDNEGNPDLGSFQMLVVTVLAVGTYLWIVLAWQGGAELVKATAVTLPDVDTTILAAFGLGQGAYLTKKYAENPS